MAAGERHLHARLAADEARRIVAADPAALSRSMSRNEDYQLPLHFAVRRNRPEMVSLLLELGDRLECSDDGRVAGANDVEQIAAVHYHVRLGCRDPVQASTERTHGVDFTLVEAVGCGLAERAESEVCIAKVSDGH